MAEEDKYGFEYKGTLPLDYKTFPIAKWIKDGKSGESNILTRLEVDIEDDKWYLFPTMMHGVPLDEKQAEHDAKEKGKHFGVFDTYNEGMKADSLIHDYFDKQLKKTPAEDKIIEELKDL
jgi:hypothetical protein|tara:strand:+ start:69 stop:428 length:360 start_codon:yes stop_codon:yes gene_type:complete